MREDRLVDRGVQNFIGMVTIMFSVVGAKLLKVQLDSSMRGSNRLFLRMVVIFIHGIHQTGYNAHQRLDRLNTIAHNFSNGSGLAHVLSPLFFQALEADADVTSFAEVAQCASL